MPVYHDTETDNCVCDEPLYVIQGSRTNSKFALKASCRVSTVALFGHGVNEERIKIRSMIRIRIRRIRGNLLPAVTLGQGADVSGEIAS